MTDATAGSINTTALPILKSNVQEYIKDVKSFQGHLVADANRWRSHFKWACVALLVLLGAEIFANTYMLPLKTQVPLFLVVREDGTVDTGTQLSDLGQDMVERVVHASVWRYVQERESYTIADAKRRFDLITLMSGKDVQRDYQSWFLDDPDGPQKSVGFKGHIAIREISITFAREGTAEVRYWREKVKVEGERSHWETWTATVQYELLHKAPASLILDDPAALRVIRYQAQKDTPLS